MFVCLYNLHFPNESLLGEIFVPLIGSCFFSQYLLRYERSKKVGLYLNIYAHGIPFRIGPWSS